MQPCKSIHGVSPETFMAEIVPMNAPVVLRGLCASWPSVRRGRESDKGLAAYLKAMNTGGPVEIMTAPPEVRGKFFYGDTLKTRNFQKTQGAFGEVLDQLLALTADILPPALYIQSTLVETCLPAFTIENEMPLLPPTVRPRVWIGNAVRVQTHYDLSDNLAVVVAGKRRFTLFPPDQLSNLYAGPFEQTLAGAPVSLADIEAPDFDKFPRLRTALAVAQVAEPEPGDVLFIPYGWWHHVRSLSTLNVLVNYWWNEAPRHLQAPYGALLHAMLSVRDMPVRQREMWKMMFSHFVFRENGDPGAHIDRNDLGVMAELTPRQHKQALAQLIRGLERHMQML